LRIPLKEGIRGVKERVACFSISCRDLIKLPYFADTIERGDRG
jgi:hypothetical protein